MNTEVLLTTSKDQYPFNAKRNNLSGVLNAFVQDPQRDQLEQDLKKVFECLCKKFKNKPKYKQIVETIEPSFSRASKLSKLQKRRRELLRDRLGVGMLSNLEQLNSSPEDLLNGLLEHLRQHNNFDRPTRLIIEGPGGNIVTHFGGRENIDEEDDEDEMDEEDEDEDINYQRNPREGLGMFDSPAPRSFFHRPPPPA